MYGRVGCIAAATARTLVGLVGAIAKHLLHNRCHLNAFAARDTLRGTLRDTLIALAGS